MTEKQTQLIAVHTSDKIKSFIKEASKQRGQTMNSFVLSAAILEAEKVLEKKLFRFIFKKEIKDEKKP